MQIYFFSSWNKPPFHKCENIQLLIIKTTSQPGNYKIQLIPDNIHKATFEANIIIEDLSSIIDSEKGDNLKSLSNKNLLPSC